MPRPKLLSRERAAVVIPTLDPGKIHRAEDCLTEAERKALRQAFMRDDCYWSNLRSLLHAILYGAPIWRGLEH